MKTIEIKNLQAPEIEELSDDEELTIVGGSTTALKFTAGPITTTIYIASGSSIDWMYDNA
ncbi:MAG: hypothetical protein HWQ38_01750 [Nostoc sp. NMS7]|uniref:hypothetical protein n=1 Tax=Nostoc sp. NMS7 TaxID=2815391 RepID=UPI0025F7B7AA|nr:hypothetical protein [Nostoc sp. NMS7]MBN3945268.1 hypothetical protein [Nostoc sp. NMS7]